MAVGRQHQVARDDDTNREARSDSERRLDVELALHDLLAGLADRVRSARADRLDEIVLVLARTGFGADAEEGREDGGLEQHAPMVIDEPRIALRIGARLSRSSTMELPSGMMMRVQTRRMRL